MRKIPNPKRPIPKGRRTFGILAPALPPGIISAEAIYSIEGRRLVTLRQCRVVEDGLHKIIYAAAEGQHRLPDVHELTRALADDVHPQQLARLQMEDELEQAGAVADDLPARDLAVLGFANLVRDAPVGQLFLGAAHHRDFRDGVDAVREQ